MQVSVIICTWNNSRRLASTLRAVSQCHVPQGVAWELVLVNNNCTDDTDAVAAEFLDKLPLVYVHEPRQGLSQARNAGLAKASGELVVFTDDDVKPWPGWVEAYWTAYREKGGNFYFGGPIESEYEGAVPEACLLAFAPPSVTGISYGPDARTLSASESFIGPNWACPAKALQMAGGFDSQKGLNPSLGRVSVGEETDLMNRLSNMGMCSWYVPGAGLAHCVPAEKCRLEHIAARAEASEFERAGSYLDGQRHVRIGGVPVVLYKWALGQWIRYVLAKATRSDKYVYHYIRMRKLIGTVKGMRQLRRGERTVTGAVT